jgi:hypothetical protein
MLNPFFLEYTLLPSNTSLMFRRDILRGDIGYLAGGGRFFVENSRIGYYRHLNESL